MRADTGVGPSIASGSQTCSGNWALLPMAPANTSSAVANSGIGLASPASSIVWIDSRMFSVASPTAPVLTQMAMIPSAKPMSPTRLTMNAFLAARAAERLRYQKPMSR